MPVTLEDVFENLGNAVGPKDETIVFGELSNMLNEALRERVDDIWDQGLEPESFDVLVSIFATANLDKTFRNLILDCLVPSQLISDRSANKMILWVISNCINLQDESAEVLRWLKPMLRFNMINPEVMDSWYNELLKRLLYPKLITHLSEILYLCEKPVFMTKDNIKLLQSFYEEHFENIYIKRVLWEYAQHVPHLVDQKFHFSKPNIWGDNCKTPGFELVVQTMASAAGVEPPKQRTTQQVLCRDLPSVEYRKKRQDENLVEIGDVKSMLELGRSLERTLLPTNELALLQNEVGIMKLIVDGPSHNFLTSLTVALSSGPSQTLIAAVSGLQDLLPYALPPATVFLSDFLINWDGNHKEEYVYSLLPRLYFRDFQALKNNILDHLLRVFVSEPAETKVKILDGLLHLITNMVAVDMRRGNAALCQTIQAPKWIEDSVETVAAVIEYVIELCKQGLILEGPNCTLLILNSILFYQKLNTLILECDLPLFFVIHQSLSCSALLSKNHVVLNELCILILQYKRNLIPFFEKKGLLGEFELQVESVMALADSTYKYLWECVGGERPENFHTTQDEFTPTKSIGMEHIALFPFLYGISKELNRDPKTLDKNGLMALLDAFQSGVADFVKYEEYEQLI